MIYSQLIEHFGGLTKAGKALGLDRRRVHEWKKHGIPSFWQLKIEHVTEGDLRADKKARQVLSEYVAFAGHNGRKHSRAA